MVTSEVDFNGWADIHIRTSQISTDWVFHSLRTSKLSVASKVSKRHSQGLLLLIRAPVADTLHWGFLLTVLKSEKPGVEAPAIVLSGGDLLSLRWLSAHRNFTW